MHQPVYQNLTQYGVFDISCEQDDPWMIDTHITNICQCNNSMRITYI